MSSTLNRRLFAQTAAAALLRAQAGRGRHYRAAIIGHTGRGNYGHEWDRAFRSLASVEVVAVADPDDKGRLAAKARSQAARDYRDYREMLAKEKPDLVAICPRWPDQRVEMVTAAAEAGAHILIEKPLAKSVEDAGRIVALAEKHKIKIQVGHTARPHPITLQVRAMLRDGAIGELIEIRSRGKEDRRAGGEDLMVLGTHCFDLLRFFAGDPEWVFAHVTTGGREVRRGDAREGTEPVGLVAGDRIAAMFSFARGVAGYFGSAASDVRSGTRFGVTLCGSKGLIFLPLSNVPSGPAMILRAPSWSMERGTECWQAVEPPPEGRRREREAANAMMVADLLDAIENHREPVCGARDGLWTIEMVAGVYLSQITGGRVAFPLRDGRAWHG